MALTAADICRAALRDLNVFDAGDAVGNDDLVFVLGKLNRVLDNWNAERNAVYAEQSATYTLTPSLSPHTIGPTGTFVIAQRPQAIDGASVVFNNATNNPQAKIIIRDYYWYDALPVPSVTSAVPTDLYYQPEWPNGKLFFYPVPKTAYQVELMTRMVLSQLLLTDTFTLPPGYQDAITLSLAESIAPAYEQAALLPILSGQARTARERVFSANVLIPTMATTDSGIPMAGGHRAQGTYYNGWTK